MDLKLKDVAELLNVSEATVQRWISDGRIPYYKLENQLRFNLGEIENWVLSSRQEGEFSAFEHSTDGRSLEGLGTQQFGLYRALHKGGVYKNVPGNTKEEVIQAAVEQISQNIGFDADVITDLLLDREKLMSTALSNGVAVPHTRDFLLQESYDVVATVFPQNPIEYGAFDKKPVDVLFFLFACDDKRHLHLLAKLAHLTSSHENLFYLREQPSKGELLEYVRNWEASLCHASEKALI